MNKRWTKINTRREYVAVFYLENSTDIRDEILLPLSKEFADYTKSIYDAILTISKVEEREIDQVVNDLLLPPSDIIRFRFQNDSENLKYGLIKLADSFTLFDCAKKSLYASACDLLKKNKEIYYKRLYDKKVERFIDNCYLGQTERGSFIASIVCPFINELDNDVVTKMSLFSSEEELSNSLTRSITKKYVKSIIKLKSVVEDNKQEDFFANKNEDDISINFADSIVELTEFAGNSTIEIIPSFSSFTNDMVEFNKPIILTKDYTEPLKTIIRKHTSVYQNSIKSGIGKLSGASAAPQLTDRNNVELTFHFLDNNNKASKAKVILDKEYLGEAVKAFELGLDVVVMGELKMNGKNKIFEYPEFKVIYPEKLLKI